MDQTAANRQLQTELYGEPLGDLIRRISSTLRLTQAKVAEVIGLSAPENRSLSTSSAVCAKIGGRIAPMPCANGASSRAVIPSALATASACA